MPVKKLRFDCISRFVIALLFAGSLYPQKAESAQNCLSRAQHYADLYNWSAAGPLFEQAEQMFQAAGDRRNALYAHIGVLRASSTPPLPERSQYLADQLANNPLLHSDLPLRLFALTVKGDVDGDWDQVSAREDWTEVAQLAKQTGATKWVFRAEGQIGFCDYYDGDLASTRQKVAEALTQATKTNDVGAEIFFLSTMSFGLAKQNILQSSGIQYAQQALDLARAYPDTGQPKVANSALVMLLV
jgi:hypothetical protein